MSIKTHCTAKHLATAALLVALTGCGLSSELFNPDFFESLGFDPQAIVNSPGRIIVAFRNNTNGLINTVDARYSDDRALIAQVEALPTDEMAIVDAVEIPANETRTLVLDCPVAVIMPGSAAITLPDESGTTQTYAGTALIVDRDFQCGDVVEVELIQTGDDADSISVRVRVLPGR